MLSKKGYHTYTADQLLNHIIQGTRLPSQPIMLTIDDTHLEHFTIAAPLLTQYDYNRVFFIMSIATGRRMLVIGNRSTQEFQEAIDVNFHKPKENTYISRLVIQLTIN